MSSIIRNWESGLSTSPRTSRYDRLHAGLVATIVVVGFLVLALLTVWLCGGENEFMPANPVVPKEYKSAEKDSGSEEVNLESAQGSRESELESAFEAIEETISKMLAAPGSTTGGVVGNPGPRDPGPTRVRADSPMKRWKIRYEADDREHYKRQLDHFGIEIGVIHSRRNDVWRVGDLAAKAGATVILSSRENENENDSAWFSHSNRTLRRWDREIAGESGVELEETLIVQFFPPQLMARIKKLEAEKLEELGRNLDDVRKTLVTLQRSGDQFFISVSAFEFR